MPPLPAAGSDELSINRILLIANLILVLLLVVAGARLRRQRWWLRQLNAACGRFNSPVPVIKPEEFDGVFRADELGVTLAGEVHMVGGEAVGGTSELESWILAVLAKSAKDMFEFGTGTGRTAYLWAKNSAPEARIVTLALAPDQWEDYSSGDGDSEDAATVALAESAGSWFYYSGTPVEHKITQLYGDSKQFDETPMARRFDLIFIDGSHACSYVKSDTEKALRMIKDGGVILWHDYRPDLPAVEGVWRYLNELCGRLRLHRLEKTTLVCYRPS